jgi:EAL domain-containing protein (putative c-di-GMP-specific phosphodiesterase class I)
MADSNIDFRQGYFFAKKFLDRHSDVHWAVKKPQAGKFIININEYLDLENKHTYKWLQNFSPVKQVQHSYLLFEITENDLKNIKN